MDHQAVVVSSSRVLEGVHGVHVVPRSPFTVEEIPKHGGHNQSTLQSSATVMGQQLMLQKNLNCKLYANSLVGVGVASSLYHSSRGTLRRYLRWLDYTMIAATSVCLSKALRNENSKLLMAASAVCLPFQPLMVSVVHTGMMEVAFARKALENPQLRTAHNVHKISSLLGGVFFVADDMFPTTPFLHAAWHLAAAVCVGTCNKLLE
ncbi:hypothetical protein Droror1_Dr00022482 [Drosera rotundifolia]